MIEGLLAGILQHIVPIILAITAGVLTKLIHSGVKKYGAKLDLETQIQAESLLNELVQQGVTYAEQLAKNVAVQRGETLDGSAKMSKAMEYVAAELIRNGLPHLTEQVLSDKIESVLGLNTLNQNHGEPQVVVTESIIRKDENDEEDLDFDSGI